eukprot:440769_1
MGSNCCQQQNQTDKSYIRLYNEYQNQQRHISQILLLGPKGAGKNTLFEQLKIIHGPGHNQQERLSYVSHIRQQIILNMNELLQRCHIHQLSCDAQVAARQFHNIDHETSNCDMISLIKILWKEHLIQNICISDRLHNYCYFFDQIDLIFATDYIPNDTHIINIKKPIHTKVIEQTFVVYNWEYHIINPCGQQSSWKKYIPYFTNINGIIFVASLADYDSKMNEKHLDLLVIGYINIIYDFVNIPEDLISLIKQFCDIEDGYIMQQQIDMFKDIVNSHWFNQNNCGIFLFLNKKDIFAEKIQNKPLNKFSLYADYNGNEDSSYDEGICYFRRKFQAVLNNKQKQIFSYATCATDRDHIEMVFNDITHAVIECGLVCEGLL